MAPKKRKPAGDGGEGVAKKKSKTTTPKSTAPTSMRITRNMKTDGPRQAVFNTAELLEAILLDLPMKQLFVIRRTSKQFRDLVNTSTKLQEKMFLRVRQDDGERWTLRALDSAARPWGDPYTEFVLASDTVTNIVQGGESLMPVELNPLICDERDDDTQPGSRLFGIGDEYGLLKLGKHLTLSGSWQQMYLTNPPSAQVTVGLHLTLNTEPRKELYTSTDVTQPSGLTVGPLVAEVMSRSQRVNIQTSVREPFHSESDTSMDAMIAQYESHKKKGSMVKSHAIFLCLAGVIAPTEEEKGRFKRKSAAGRGLSSVLPDIPRGGEAEH